MILRAFAPLRMTRVRPSWYAGFMSLKTIHWHEIRPLAVTEPLIVVRSPGEVAHGNVPVAVNAPVFDDDGAPQVGLTYKQEGTQPAVHLGLELFAAKAERYLQHVDAVAQGGKRIAVHCARGGMRSRLVGL